MYIQYLNFLNYNYFIAVAAKVARYLCPSFVISIGVFSFLFFF